MILLLGVNFTERFDDVVEKDTFLSNDFHEDRFCSLQDNRMLFNEKEM